MATSKEVKDRIADFFEASELVDFLRISVEDVIEAFEEDIEEAIDDIEDMMGVKHDRKQKRGSYE
jgi:hypothetical protein